MNPSSAISHRDRSCGRLWNWLVASCFQRDRSEVVLDPSRRGDSGLEIRDHRLTGIRAKCSTSQIGTAKRTMTFTYSQLQLR